MIELGVIGTNWITHQFVQAARDCGKYKLTAVYSRKMTTAEEFAKPYGAVNCMTDLDDFLHLNTLDVVYIASPNSLHYSQAKAAILAGKHVIVEKPAFSTPKEMAEIISLANEKDVLFFEAARNIHEAAFRKVKDFLPGPEHVIGANFSYMKYSSRYDQVLQGEEPNIFSPQFSGGSLADLGVYPIYATLAWFGKPSEVHHYARKIKTGVDGMGTLILRYDLFDVTILHGKIGDARLGSEIYLDNGTLELDGINAINKAEFVDRKQKTIEKIEIKARENPMIEEAKDFAKIIEAPHDQKNVNRYEEWVELARTVNLVLFEARTQADIRFSADKE